MKTPLLAALMLPLTGLAHPWTPPVDRISPAPVAVEVVAPVAVVPPAPVAWRARDRWAREDDVRDLRSVDATLAQLDRASATRDVGLLRWVDGRARDLLSDELNESRREAERARFEPRWDGGWRIRRADWKVARVARLEDGYRALGWRIDPWSLAQRRAILVDLDRLNRQELAAR